MILIAMCKSIMIYLQLIIYLSFLSFAGHDAKCQSFVVSTSNIKSCIHGLLAILNVASIIQVFASARGCGWWSVYIEEDRKAYGQKHRSRCTKFGMLLNMKSPSS